MLNQITPQQLLQMGRPDGDSRVERALHAVQSQIVQQTTHRDSGQLRKGEKLEYIVSVNTAELSTAECGELQGRLQDLGWDTVDFEPTDFRGALTPRNTIPRTPTSHVLRLTYEHKNH